MTYIFLKATSIITNQKSSKIRFIIACVFSVLCVFIYPYLSFVGVLLILFKLMVGFVIVCLAFEQEKMKQIFALFCVFMLMTALYGGVNMFVCYSIYGDFSKNADLPTLGIVTCVAILIYLTKQIYSFVKTRQKISSFTYNVTIFDNQKTFETRAYLDSGNVICDPKTNTPIVLINHKLFFKINKNFSSINLLNKKISDLKNAHYIPIKTASGVSEMLVFSIDKFEIKKSNEKIEYENVWFGLSKVNFNSLDCDVLLNPKIMGGV